MAVTPDVPEVVDPLHRGEKGSLCGECTEVDFVDDCLFLGRAMPFGIAPGKRRGATTSLGPSTSSGWKRVAGSGTVFFHQSRIDSESRDQLPVRVFRTSRRSGGTGAGPQHLLGIGHPICVGAQRRKRTPSYTVAVPKWLINGAERKPRCGWSLGASGRRSTLGEYSRCPAPLLGLAREAAGQHL